MMWKTTFLILLSIVLREAQAARRVDAGALVRRSLGKRSEGEGKRELSERLELTAGEGLDPQRSETTAKGSKTTRYQETFQGVKVYDSVVTADDQDESDVTGEIFQDIGEDVDSVQPKLSEAEAVKTAMKLEGTEEAHAENKQSKLMIYVDKSEIAHLAYMVSFLHASSGKPSRPVNFIEANSGKVLDSWESLDTASHKMPGFGGNEKTGRYEYGKDYDYLTATTNDNGINCLMENNYVKVVNLNHGTSGTTTYSVKCKDGAKDQINGGFSPADDALYFGTVIYNMYNDWFKTPPLTIKLTMRVHYSNNYENAFWDGQAMTFGDGQNTFYPLVSLDVSAHEVSHGFTEQTSGLEYRDQSGGMNEAFSDMAGEAVKYYMKNGKNDWKVGADIFKGDGALRYMDNPEKDGRSIGHASKYSSGMDVHFSSGVYNKAFYILATKPNWNVKKAFEVMVRANQMHWKASSTFDQGACGVEKAALDKGYNKEDVTSAFEQVGVKCSGTVSENKEILRVTASGATDDKKYYTVQSTGTSPLTIKTTGGTGDVDLYVRFGSKPTLQAYDARPYNTGNTETVSISPAKQGTYHIMLHAYSEYSGVTLTVSTVSSLSERALKTSDPKNVKMRRGVKKVDLGSLFKHTKKVHL